jgi:hypothetical protein
MDTHSDPIPSTSAHGVGFLRLPLDFDPAALARDLDRIAPGQWTPHFNTRDYEGEWSGLALRGPAGATHPVLLLSANPGTKEWADTELLASCPYFAEVLATLRCPLLSARLLALAPGAAIKEHRDPALELADGEVRLHIPVRTNAAVEFYLDGERVRLGVGETWYLNVSRRHRVCNRGRDPRVHLVVDCVVDDWLRELVQRALEQRSLQPAKRP